MLPWFCLSLLFFFFSSRRRHTRFDCDWSSDVCSSDLLGQLPAWARLGERPAHNPFTLGVASGDPEPDNVLLWTRLTPPLSQLGETDTTAMPALKIRWELAHDPLFRHIVRSGEAMAQPEWGHGVHVQVGGLAPDRWYHYRFMLGQAGSGTGRCRTAPAPRSMPQRLRQIGRASGRERV